MCMCVWYLVSAMRNFLAFLIFLLTLCMCVCALSMCLLALRCGSIICSSLSQSQWMWHYAERYRTSMRHQNLFSYEYLVSCIHLRSWRLDTGCCTLLCCTHASTLLHVHCSAIYLNVDISNLRNKTKRKTNGKKQRNTRHNTTTEA